jgi:hypothetical protein
MTTAKKVENYSAEVTAKIVADYAAGITVETIAASVGKSTRSIVAKLSRMGAYHKKEYVSKTGAKPVSKEELVSQIANIIGKTSEELGGLEKANKTTLSLLLDYLTAV